MTDKEIDQRLHDALTPDVPEDRLFVFKEMTKESEGTTMKLKKILKPAIVMAACAALILGVSRVPDFVSLKKAVTSDEPGTFSEKLANAFTVKVMAAGKKKTATKEKPIPIVNTENSSAECWCGSSDVIALRHEIGKGKVNPDDQTKHIDGDLLTGYCLNYPVTCEGKNIDTITYSINKGTFQIFTKKGSNYILKGEKYNKKLNCGEIPPDGYEEQLGKQGDEIGVGYEKEFYSSYTVSADNQTFKDVTVNICDEVKLSPEMYVKMWDFENETLQGKLEARNAAIGDTVVTCEIMYKDGSKQTQKMKVGNAIMTPEEAGEVVPNDEKDVKRVYTTYELI